MTSPREERIAAARNPKPGEFGPFAEFVRLDLELHRLDLRGAFESAEADEIRDRMDAPWYAMTDEEQAVARKVSATLNAAEERLKRADSPGPPESGSAGQEGGSVP